MIARLWFVLSLPILVLSCAVASEIPVNTRVLSLNGFVPVCGAAERSELVFHSPRFQAYLSTHTILFESNHGRIWIGYENAGSHAKLHGNMPLAAQVHLATASGQACPSLPVYREAVYENLYPGCFGRL